jgi:hypothetical protein
LLLSTLTFSAVAPNYPTPKLSSWLAKDFQFHTGEVMPELRLGFTTVGEPTGEPVVILHGTTGSGAGLLTTSATHQNGASWSARSKASRVRAFCCPASEQTVGHGTTGQAQW